MQVEKLEDFVLGKLQERLPDYLSYHNVHHTKEVISNALDLGKGEGLSSYDLELLHTAALLHDTGYMVSNADHERISCDFAREYMPQFDYTPSQVEQVCAIIMTTQLPQSAHDTISKILCDADIYYLGTNNYQLYSSRLFRELKYYNPALSNEEWLQQQINFLGSHEYYTNTARKRLNAVKNQNLKKVVGNIRQSHKPHNDFSVADLFMMVLGSFIAAFALKGFLIPNNFLDGGITGISLLLHGVYGWNFPILFIILSIPLVILARYVVNSKFTFKAAISIICMTLCLHFIHYPVLTEDNLLASVFGGFFAGIGMGLNIRAGSALDGTDVLAVYTLKRSSFTISEIILAINTIIFIIAAFHFGIETAMYSILAYFTATKTVDYVVEGVEAYTGVTIISAHSDRIKEKLVNEMGKGITVYKGERGFLPGKYEIHTDVDIIFTVITRLELRRLKNLVYAEDPKAFVFANTIKETTGGVLKRKAAH